MEEQISTNIISNDTISTELISFETENPISQSKVKSKNWKWEDSYALIKQIHLDGKNWSKILEIMHNQQHRIIQIPKGDYEKLRIHYNGLLGKSSKLSKFKNGQLKVKKYKRPTGMTNEEAFQKQIEFVAEENIKKEEMKIALELIEQIENREKGLNSTKMI